MMPKNKYLGDILDNTGTVRQTIEDRKNRGFAIVAEILAILNEIPLGKYKMEIGLKLRQAMLINGIFFKSEAWHNIHEAELKLLESVIEYLLRSLVKAHSKTPLEFLYLEAGTVPIRFIISSRRLIYLQTILKREDSELTKKIHIAQKNNPSKGDFTKLVESDFALIGESLDETAVENSDTHSYKNFIKAKIKIAALNYLNERKNAHSKISSINYDVLRTQEYFLSPIFSDEEVNLLFALRSRYVECRANFKNRYRENDIQCQLCMQSCDTQKHILDCSVIQKHITSNIIEEDKAEYEDLFGEVRKQKRVTVLFKDLIEIRKKLNTDPSTSGEVLKNSFDLHDCIDIFSSGK